MFRSCSWRELVIHNFGSNRRFVLYGFIEIDNRHGEGSFQISSVKERNIACVAVIIFPMLLDHSARGYKKGAPWRYFNIALGAYWSKKCWDDEVRWMITCKANGWRFDRTTTANIVAVG